MDTKGARRITGDRLSPLCGLSETLRLITLDTMMAEGAVSTELLEMKQMSRAVAILLSIFTALASLANYLWWLYGEPTWTLSVACQVALVVLTLVVLVTYGSRRIRPGYEFGLPRVFTLGFAIAFVSFMANAGILIAILMRET
jgi:hypothetical protein